MAGMPPMETCQWCRQQYPRVQISQHEASCDKNPANK